MSQAVNTHNKNQIDFRRRLVQSYPNTRLESIHLSNTRLLPTRYDMLDELTPNGVVCEIGVANGDFSAQILHRCRPHILHLVDAWEAERYSACYEQVCERFAKEIENDKIVLHKGYSTDLLPKFPDQYFDWVYIDSSHNYHITAQELRISMHKVKPCGIIAGHDYTPGNVVTPVPYGVVQAVQEFCVENGWKYLYLTCESHCYVSFALKRIDV